MSIFQKQLNALNESIKDQNYHTQICIVSQICKCIDQSKTREKLIQELLSFNLATAINNVISTQMAILRPTMKLLCHLIEDYHFRSYQFLPILKNIFRVLVFVVQSDEIGNSQLEFFDIIDILDFLMKRFLSNNFCKKKNECLQGTFMCIMKFIELVLSQDCIEVAVKNLMVEIYFHLLTINGVFKCICNNFELIMKVANLGEEFLDRFVEEHKKDDSELWLYKMLQILLKIYESFILHIDCLDLLAVKVFENLFVRYIEFVIEPLTSSESIAQSSDLFKLCISVFNAIIWTPICSRKFRSQILKTFVKFNGDTMVFCLSKYSKKITKHTSYSAKIFLTALVTYSDHTPCDKHGILDTFLQCRLRTSIFDLNAYEHDVLKMQNALILLYGCSFFKPKLSSPLVAHKILENLLVILNHPTGQLDDNQIWSVLKIFAYCSNYALLTRLEYAGVQKKSEMLLMQASRTIINTHKIRQPIDKYVIALAKEFSPDINIFNSMTFFYLSQEPTLTSAKVKDIIPTYSALPLLMSSDHNQVENAVKILQRKQLTKEDLDFVVERCFHNFNVEEITIGAAMTLIGKNMDNISTENTIKIYSGTIAFLEAKQFSLKFTEECYLCIWRTCANLCRFTTKANTDHEMVEE